LAKGLGIFGALELAQSNAAHMFHVETSQFTSDGGSGQSVDEKVHMICVLDVSRPVEMGDADFSILLEVQDLEEGNGAVVPALSLVLGAGAYV
jgi:hypothetical protein